MDVAGLDRPFETDTFNVLFECMNHHTKKAREVVSLYQFVFARAGVGRLLVGVFIHEFVCIWTRTSNEYAIFISHRRARP